MICKTSCTSCGACYSVCPVNAISMEYDSLEQLIPKIHKGKCVNCKLCEKVCPQNAPKTTLNPIQCYAAYSSGDEDLKHSASGGIAAVFSRYMQKIGSVYGCDYDENVKLSHFKLNTDEDIRRSQSSKYSYSTSYVVFKDIKNNLNQGSRVLFIGTPCQVAGLLGYLQKNYENLITVDLICHGTPSTRLLQKHLSEKNLQPPISKIRFRGEFDQKLTVWNDTGIIYQEDKLNDIYFSSFYRNMISHESCYTCKYACSKRISDITIGDFWGLGELIKIELKTNRPSIILINTDKGKAFFDEVSPNLVYEARTVEEGIKGNGRLNSPPGKNTEAKLFQFFYKLKFGFKRSIYATNYVLLAKRKIKKFFSK